MDWIANTVEEQPRLEGGRSHQKAVSISSAEDRSRTYRHYEWQGGDDQAICVGSMGWTLVYDGRDGCQSSNGDDGMDGRNSSLYERVGKNRYGWNGRCNETWRAESIG